jgi:CHAT domain-containing protein
MEAYTVRQAAQDALAMARSLDPPDAALVAGLEVQLAAAEQEHQASLAAITARGDQLEALVPGRSSVLDLPAVQALLDDQTTLVSYWVLGDQGALAFVIAGDSFTTVELPDATSANLASAVGNTLSWTNREQAHPKPLRDLYTWLVAPLAEHLQTPQVVIVPHQQLQYVPFAALSDGQTYFGQQHLLSMIPSASALPFIQQNATESAAKANTHALVFGNPTTGDPSLLSLVYAATEAKAVASLLDTVAVTDAEASETRLRDEAAGSRVIHLAAHGGYNVANPLYSAVYLAPDGEGTSGDGRLETHEVYGLDLKGNQLVALSACQSNVGELSAGDELVGLTRAFFFAGTPTVLSSLWAVDDEATEALMTAFYRHWQAGLGKAEALQAAQAEVRANPLWASPFYWAGFVLNGDPGQPGISSSSAPISQPAAGDTPPAGQSSGRSPWPVMVAGLVTAVLVAGLAIRRSRRK